MRPCGAWSAAPLGHSLPVRLRRGSERLAANLARSGKAAAALLLVVLCAGAPAAAEGRRAAALGNALDRAVAYTLATQLPDGRFRYDFDFLVGGPTGEDHIVRQAGTAFALAEAGVRRPGDADLAAAVRRALEALEERSLPISRSGRQRLAERLGLLGLESWRIGRVLDGFGMLYAPSGPGRVVTDHGSYREAYAGATALALLAELHYRRATGDDRFAVLRRAWAHGLQVLRVPGRGVRHDPTTLEESGYYNGETWLALAAYHAAQPEDEEVARTLAGLEAHVVRRHGGRLDGSFVSWGLRAAAVRAADGHRTQWLPFVREQVRRSLDREPPPPARRWNGCAVLEGWLAAHEVLAAGPEDPDLVATLEARIAAQLREDLALQVEPGQERLELGGGAVLRAPLLRDHAGAFLAGPYRPSVRTDFMQHCISALAMAERQGIAPAERAAR